MASKMDDQVADMNRLETHLLQRHGYSLRTTQGLDDLNMSAVHRAAHEDMPVGFPHSHENEVQRATWVEVR